MKKVVRSDTLKTVISILSKEGLLFRGNITTLDKFKVALNILLVVTVNIFVILDIINALKSDNIKMASWMICVLIPAAGCGTKGFTLLVNRKCLFALLQDLSSLRFSEHDDKLNKYIRIIDKRSNLLLKYFLISVSLIIISFCVLPFAINIRMGIPAPFDTGRFDIPYKLFHLMYCTYMGYNMSFLDVLYMTLMGLGIAQLDVLKERLTDILEEVNKREVFEEGNVLQDTNITARCVLREYILIHEMIIK